MAENVYLTYYQKNKEPIKAKAKEYYKKNKEKITAQAKEKYYSLSDEDKEKIKECQKIYRNKHSSDEDKLNKREYMKNWYAKLPEDMKNKIREDARNRYYKPIKVC